MRRGAPNALFAYGTLMFPEVLEAVCGRGAHGEWGVLPGFARRTVRGAVYPAAMPQAGGQVEGVVWRGLGVRCWQRLDCFEGELYTRQVVSVLVGDVQAETQAYIVSAPNLHRLGGADWCPAWFARQQLGAYLASIRAR